MDQRALPKSVGAAAPPESAWNARARILSKARQYLGVKYEINLPNYPPADATSRGWGKQYPEPDHGFDCSGYVLHVLRDVNLLTDLDPLYSDVARISLRCDGVSAGSSKPGDLVFFENTYQRGLSHIGIVTESGGRRFISAREPVVSEDPLAGYWLTKLSHYGRPEGLY